MSNLLNNTSDLEKILESINSLPNIIITKSTDANNFPAVVEGAILVAYDANT